MIYLYFILLITSLIDTLIITIVLNEIKIVSFNNSQKKSPDLKYIIKKMMQIAGVKGKKIVHFYFRRKLDIIRC